MNKFRGLAAIAALLLTGSPLLALDPHKSLTQYSRTTWTQMQGLPQDTIRALTQTLDGYLWIGTDEGLARFDGYEFVNFHKANGDLPSNSITALAASPDGGLWVGTSNGLVYFREGRFRTYTLKDGLPDATISQLAVDRQGVLWVVAGIQLARLEGNRFLTVGPGPDLPLTTIRNVRTDAAGELWIAGLGGVGKWVAGKFVPLIPGPALDGMFITPMVTDRHGDLWMGGNTGLLRREASGRIRSFLERDGLPENYVRALLEDRDGTIWVGTNAGIARFNGVGFVTPNEGGPDTDLVRCLFEDREGNLWVGSNSGLTRYRDTVFTVFGKPEGLPSDEPNTVFQDSAGRIWAGYHDAGVVLLSPGKSRVYTTRDGLPNVEIFSIREGRNGDLLIAARGGFARMHEGRITTFVPPDPLARLSVFDALEDDEGTIWLATPGGLCRVRGKEFRIVVPGGPVLQNAMVALASGPGGVLWAGGYGKGLWRIQGDDIRHYTTANGLANDQIRSLYPGPNGTLWIGTFGGGLSALREGKFTNFSEKDGLLSDNIADISDDGESLWLSTTRGICRIGKSQLAEFAAGRRNTLAPVNYGLEDGLRSAQCSPSYPNGGGGKRTSDGRLWFTTTRGIAVFDPNAHQPPPLAPVVQLVEVTADGDPVGPGAVQLSPGVGRVQIRYTAIHLSAPDRVQYSYRLTGLDSDWVQAGARRLINYNSLHHGEYRFTVRAELPGGLSGERSYGFEVQPHFYETLWFKTFAGALVLAAAWGVYWVRLRQIRFRFAGVLQERARLAREIHDTLAQGFVGISSQLDAVAMCMPDEGAPARRHLDLARRMARHSLTEARRSVMDLRDSALDGQDLAAALQFGTRGWTAGSGVEVEVDVSGERALLPEDFEQHLLRIAQEAVANVMKHAGATSIRIKLHLDAGALYLRVTDNGRGFESEGAFSSGGGHFGIIGMRERAERLGGELRLVSRPGEGTEVQVKVPLP